MHTLRELFFSNGFMPYGYCYMWKGRLLRLHLISDALIFLAYISISLTLLYFVRKRRDLIFKWMFMCFSVFIVACGFTHATGIWTLWHATYGLLGVIKAITALASVPTAILLAGLVPEAHDNPSKDKVRLSEEHYRMLVGQVKDYAIFMLDPEGRVMSWNEGAQRIKGYSPEEIIGRHFSCFYTPEDIARERPKEELQVAAKEGRFEDDGWRVRKDGSHFWANVVITALRDEAGKLRGFSKVTRDVTERKKNAYNRSLIESSLDPLVTIAPDGKITDVNSATEIATGRTRDELIGADFCDYFTDPEKARAGYQKVFREGVVRDYELEILHHDGHSIPVLYNASVYRDAAGTIIGVFAAARDITERKRAAEALQNEKAFTESIIDSLPDTFYVIDSRGRYLRWNKNAEKVLGYSREEVATLDPLAYVPEDERPLAASKMQEALAKGRATVDIDLLTKDGRKIPYILTATRAVIGDRVYLVGIGVDITERRQVEAEKARLVTAIEQSAEAVVITDTHGDIEYVNPAFTRITGYSREEVLGQNPRMLKSTKQEPEFYHQLWTTILKGEIWHGELINRRKDGKLYTEELNIAPVRGAHGEITHFIATKQDVTERKRLEVQFRQAQKMEAVGRLAGGVAHDFNNLLTLINGYSEMVLEGRDSSDPLRGPLEEIRKAGDRAASLTRQLLAFSRQQVLAPRVLDLNALVAEVEKMLRRLIGEDVDLALVRAPALGRVKADPGQIDQILMNLAVNARDAMPQGGKLVIETANVELDEAYADRHSVVTPGRYVMLAVSDTGIGMNAETQSHIFEPFFTTKEKGKGTGLGLAMVYGIVKQSGGYIWVYSEPGRGTTFKIYLPQVEEAAESVRASEAPRRPIAGAETILLVEDEEAVRALAARILQDLGYKVLESTSPEDALQIGERLKEPIHLLLTDVVLPRMSGRKIAEHLAFLRPDIKVLYMSGYTDDTVFRNGVLETGTAFLQKPFTPTGLARKTREVLDAGREEAS